VKISLVLPEHYNVIWPDIDTYMQGAAKYTYGRFNADDIKDGLSNKRQQLWIAFDDSIKGAVITEIIQYPRMRTLIMHFTGGKELQTWKDPMLNTLQSYARDKGCNSIESYGRRGWEKVFKNDGFKSRFMYYELPV
jgi:hypothetical protein